MAGRGVGPVGCAGGTGPGLVAKSGGGRGRRLRGRGRGGCAVGRREWWRGRRPRSCCELPCRLYRYSSVDMATYQRDIYADKQIGRSGRAYKSRLASTLYTIQPDEKRRCIFTQLTIFHLVSCDLLEDKRNAVFGLVVQYLWHVDTTMRGQKIELNATTAITTAVCYYCNVVVQ